jgi:hypothetical protein
VDFGEMLDYNLSYVNKGDSAMRDVVIMAVLESDFLDWTGLKEENGAKEKGNTLIWTKNEIPGLAEIGVEEEGEINFSIPVLPFREMDLGKDFEIKSYAQYSIGETEDEDVGEDNQSNTIVNQINSDLTLEEEVRYFNNDNIPVGTGPLPPKSGETTTFKVYWTVVNNLHELKDLEIEVKLPENVEWNNKVRASVGTIDYISEERKVVWDIGRLPVSVYRADGEFNIAITPESEDVDKILVLMPGSKATAVDTVTDEDIEVSVKPKTTKLEDDEIAQMNNDGRVEE